MPTPRWLHAAAWTLAAAALCYGLAVAIDSRWVSDDAFISYRYCRNFVDGLGLVYNAGERVEGYTNFLWVMLLSAGMVLGADPIPLSQVLGIACFVGTALVLAWTARQMGVLPLAAVGWVLHEHAAIFATGGLETALFTLLVTLGLVQLVTAVQPGQFVRGGLWLILATMTRPDGALFYAVGSLVVLVVALRRKEKRLGVAYAVPFVAVYLPYFAWKFAYYGYPFPNTYYAKSAGRAYVEQGWYYVELYFSCYYWLLPALVVPLGLLAARTLRPRSRAADAAPGFKAVRGLALITLFTLPFLFYVVRVGGDFMFSRFCLPVTPALFLGLQLMLGRRGPAVDAALLVAVAGLSFAPNYPAENLTRGHPRYVGEERENYPAWYVESYRILGRRLKEIFAGRDVRVVIGGAQALLGYYGEFPYVLEIHGLTDEFIAHREVERRGRPGHEKQLGMDHPYLREKGIDLLVGGDRFPVIPGDPPVMTELRKFSFYAEGVPYMGEEPISGFAPAALITYDPDLLEPLRGREDVRFTHFPTFLDGYIAALDRYDVAKIRADLRAFDGFYFDHADDPARRQKILDHLATR